jgi:hypothetical protein
MLSGFGYLISQIAILLMAAVIAGIVAGRYVWPRSGPRQVVANPLAPVETEASARLVVVEQRLRENEGRLADTEEKLAEMRRKLSEAQAEVLRIGSRAQAMVEQKEAEMGRLESGATAVLESTISAHREQIASLELRLQAAEETDRQQSQRP